MTIPFAVPECRVAHLVERHDDSLVVPVRLDAASGRCPECGQASRSVHGRYHRHPADLPLSASRTTLRIEVRRFYCRNPTCRRRTFAETPLTLLTLRARRTRGFARHRPGSAAPAAVQAARVFSRISTCRPAARPCCGSSPACRCPTPGSHPGRIDDWAIRKGSRYGTIVVDLDRRRVVDLLPDRTAPAVAGWLARHPASHSSPGIARSSTREAQASALPGATGRRSLAPAHQHAAGRRTLARPADLGVG